MNPDKCYTMTQASQHLSDISNFVEKGHCVELIRYGKPVAMVVSTSEYKTFHKMPHSDFWQVLQNFKLQCGNDSIDLDHTFADVRETSSGREMIW
jgi:antitoxin (DNA-binding transcriptional repressor) of toxin-antitoxin stability system